MYQDQIQPEVKTHSLKIRIIALIITIFVVIFAIGTALSLEFAGWGLIHLATKHPALITKYDPHHWVGRIAILAMVYSTVRSFVAVMRPPLATFRAWQRVFLPWPWERREAEGREAERPAV